MKVTWTPNAGVPVVLGDDSLKQTVVMDSLGGGAVEQVVPLFRATNAARYSRGNVAGEAGFSVARSHANLAAALTYWKGEYGRLGTKGTLVLTEGVTTVTCSNAVLKAVVLAGVTGTRWAIRYGFGVGTMV